jgi:hypothetical protein
MARIGTFLVALLLVWGAPVAARTINGIDFPEQVFVEDSDQALVLSGLGVVERRFLPFYAVALYVRPGRNEPAALAGGMEPCRVVIHWLTPQLEPADAQAYWLEAVARGADADALVRLKPSLERIFKALGGAARDDVLQFDYHPDAGLKVARNGTRVGHFAGLELNRLILGLWVGASADRDVRDALLGLAPASAQLTPR